MIGERRGLAAFVAERMLLFIAEEKSQGPGVGKNRSFRRSIRNAAKGVVLTFLSERNFRFEIAFFAFVVLLGFLLDIDRIEWALVLSNSFLVFALEVKNTSLELTVDLVTSAYHYNAKGSKDAASGAVLIAVVSALLTGALVFIPRIVALLSPLLAGGPGR